MLKLVPAKKIGMTTALQDEGNAVPVTILQPVSCVVTQIKRPSTDGYSAIQVAFGKTRPKLVTKGIKGVLSKAGVQEAYRGFYEYRCTEEELGNFTLGQEIHPEQFLLYWDGVEVTGTSKGKGFAGAMKRWGFAGQQRTHGDPDNRRPMSNGATDAARVFKGSRRPGRMGSDRVTLKGLTVYDYDPSLNVLALGGSVPGANGGIVFVRLISERSREDIELIEEVVSDHTVVDATDSVVAESAVQAQESAGDAPVVEAVDEQQEVADA
jgi:large subunit ribosomal protein L3